MAGPKANTNDKASLYADTGVGPAKGTDTVMPTSPAPRVVPKPEPVKRAMGAGNSGPGEKSASDGV